MICFLLFYFLYWTSTRQLLLIPNESLSIFNQRCRQRFEMEKYSSADIQFSVSMPLVYSSDSSASAAGSSASSPSMKLRMTALVFSRSSAEGVALIDDTGRLTRGAGANADARAGKRRATAKESFILILAITFRFKNFDNVLL